ncbi:uncharacterized protein LY79DRAFT_385290 [Colletotrichum navitas]|uniref:Uncharacterized protein n=1 Tax=Colletotrichum navitas TaxID=681940 RepID=A0AAD8Q9C7_9PEZI|nr:uncharacterized protein LY79DRAFT_385290 [Colletotrichum navitas]KAK1597432.1 hypothetical protein LY79DRAFT_385290 [Colletotrichum navitas]
MEMFGRGACLPPPKEMNYIQPPGDMLNASLPPSPPSPPPSPPPPPIPSMQASLLLEAMPRPRPIAARDAGRTMGDVGRRPRRRRRRNPYWWYSGFCWPACPPLSFSFPLPSSFSYVPRSGPPLRSLLRKPPHNLPPKCLRRPPCSTYIHTRAREHTRTQESKRKEI